MDFMSCNDQKLSNDQYGNEIYSQLLNDIILRSYYYEAIKNILF